MGKNRWVGLIVLAALALVSPCGMAQEQVKYLLRETGVPGDIRGLFVTEQRDRIVVTLGGGSTPNGEAVAGPSNPTWTPLKDLGIQVWVLRSDGSALTLKPHGVTSGGIGNAGYTTDMMFFAFEYAPPDDIAAVVLRVNGKFMVRPIKADQQPQGGKAP